MKFLSLITIIAVIIGTSCTKDFLDLKPRNDVILEDFFKTTEDAEAALIGCYASFHKNDYYRKNFPYYIDLLGQTANPQSSDNAAKNLKQFQSLKNNGKLHNLWVVFYQSIANTNFLLKYIDGIESIKLDTDNYREEIKAEARFIRALNYYFLVQLFETVPIIVEPLEEFTNLDNYPYEGLNSERNIYSVIVTDLNYAKKWLPEEHKSASGIPNNAKTRGRAVKGAAMALLAKVYASIASMKVEGFDVDACWANCILYCDSVIKSPLYELITDYDDLFKIGSENLKESILEIQFSTQAGSNMAYNSLPYPYVETTWEKEYRPSKSVLNLFENESTVRHKASFIKGISGASSDTTFHRFKSRESAGGNSPDNFIAIRLADIILLQAEALCEVYALPAKSAELLNSIRARAGMNEYEYPVDLPTKKELRRAIHLERLIELNLEGHSWFDKKRWTRGELTVNDFDKIDETGVVMPIPNKVKNNNPAIAEQLK